MTGSLGRPDQARESGPRDLEFDAQSGSDSMAGLFLIADQCSVVDERCDSAGELQGDTNSEVEVISIRRIVLECEFADARLPCQPELYPPLGILELVHIFPHGLGN